MLVRYYGDVPLIIETTDVTNPEISRATIAEVYDLIVNDLLFATQNLPEVWGDDKKARPTCRCSKNPACKSVYYHGRLSD